MEITNDITERSFYKATGDISGDNQINWKGDGKSGNTISKLHLLDSNTAVT